MAGARATADRPVCREGSECTPREGAEGGRGGGVRREKESRADSPVCYPRVKSCLLITLQAWNCALKLTAVTSLFLALAPALHRARTCVDDLHVDRICPLHPLHVAQHPVEEDDAAA